MGKNELLEGMYQAAYRELTENILPWWSGCAFDKKQGMFVGRVTIQNEMDFNAPRHIILTTRLLWTFSKAAKILHQDKWLFYAERAYCYLTDFFEDKEYGGYFTQVGPDGQVLDSTKSVYGNAYAVYALAEYGAASGDQKAVQKAMGVFSLLLDKAYDWQYKGFLESFTRNWERAPWVQGMSRTPFDEKTMNTQLHVLEAFTTLYKVTGNALVKYWTRSQLQLLVQKVVDPVSGHFYFFQRKDWTPTTCEFSNGHDIEGSWLMWDTARALGEAELLQLVGPVCVCMARVCSEVGVTEDGAVISEVNPQTGKKTRYWSWWEQTEAVVGFLNAWEMTGESHFLQISKKILDFTLRHFVDKAGGGWFPRLNAETNCPWPDQCKADYWIGPYHNARMCMELMERCDHGKTGEVENENFDF